jgi:hypothetical protein
MDMNIEQIRQRLSEFKDTPDQSNFGLLYKSVPLSSKIKGLTFCEKLDLMSIGMQSGEIKSFRLEIQNLGMADEEENGR